MESWKFQSSGAIAELKIGTVKIVGETKKVIKCLINQAMIANKKNQCSLYSVPVVRFGANRLKRRERIRLFLCTHMPRENRL